MPTKQQQQTNLINMLRSLSINPTEQTAYALKLLETERNYLTVDAALQVLSENFEPKARQVLLNLYRYYAENGPKRDQGATLRVAILKVLQKQAQPEDLSLLEQAVSTVEFMPPGRFDEIAMGLRSAAVVIINELDSKLASYYCVKLLNDEYTSKMSGEPAVTAVQVLASQHNYLPLYQYILNTGEKISEVLAECLRNSLDLPESLLQDVVARFSQTKNEVVLIGLFDLVLAHRASASYYDFILNFLTTTSNYDLYRYLLLQILTSKQKVLISKLLDVARVENDKRRLSILIEVLTLSSRNDPQIKSLLKQLKG